MADIILLGNDSSNNSILSNNIIIYNKVTAINSGMLSKIYGYALYATSNAKVAILGDNSGSPGNVLTSAVGSFDVIGGWDYITVPEISVAKDTVYWIGCIVESLNNIGEYRGAGYTLRALFISYSSFSFSNNPTGLEYVNRKYALAGWGTEAAAGCPRQAMHMRRLM